MSLPASQQRILDTIESALQKREPRLAAMFAMFTRLNTNERLPRTERLEAARWWARHRRRQAAHPGSSPRSRRPQGRPPAMSHVWLIVPFLIALLASAVFLSMGSSQASCLPASGVHGLITSQSHPKACSSIRGSHYFGHGP